jgi:hypothetical protein
MRRIDLLREPRRRSRSPRPYTLSTADGRVAVTVHPGPPTYAYVTHDGLTESAVDAALLELAGAIPAPCWVVVLPQLLEGKRLWPGN